MANPPAVGKEPLSLSKGLQVWTYLEPHSPITVELDHKGQRTYIWGPSSNYTDANDIEFPKSHEHATLSIKVNGQTLKQYTMQLGAIDGSLTTTIPATRANPAFKVGGYWLSIGIMNAPSGYQDQLYVHMTSDQSDWMAALPPGTPYHALCLAGAHDAGMNTMQGLDMITSNKDALDVALKFLLPFISILVAHKFPDYAVWLGGLTQKDTISNMLAMGVRYFDFRPGYWVNQLRPFFHDIRHQHAFLPGALWKDNLTEILRFLTAHKNEVVQVALGSSGFQHADMIPSTADLKSIMAQAKASPGVDPTLKVAGLEAFQQTLDSLRSTNSRLVLTDANHGPKMKVLDAYSDGAWATLKPLTIREAFQNAITPAAQQGKDQTEFQVQGTATAWYINAHHYQSLIDANHYNLPLVQTKGQFDNNLLGYVLRQVPTLTAKQHWVILDDFVDGVTVETAIEITKKRIAQLGLP
ncbi:uncharacterized protein HMPREF1541_03190 [Cyphellophora europaea CBS 101466]|uniref:Uncharacterized protein n=1 Tax=Cyphellophora europaea (strain CBS 101466) TaxID=1220924 RepID=W2RY46_CYPE1|nr:uncharacterized protein HMPREF1541_03190 [Cyphellophora europaea CBS 101466]ETN41255.1 hypothetical protein HMPREF1541_03190 [Cyphellophora europaea CBS 101466]